MQLRETVQAARSRYFAANGFSDATYRDRWVKFRVGPLPVVFPNTESRKRAVPLHDLHHVATGYTTTLVGEAEIGAWEIAAGCGPYAAAWLLNAMAFAVGLALAPRRTYRAFVRGRHCRTLYRDGWQDEYLALDVGELRKRLRLDDDPPPRATWRDRSAFVGWALAVLAPGAVALASVIAMLR